MSRSWDYCGPATRAPTPPPTISKPRIWLALAQLPKRLRRGRQTPLRTDSGGGTHKFVAWLVRCVRWLSYSVGMTITDAVHQTVLKVPANCHEGSHPGLDTDR